MGTGAEAEERIGRFGLGIRNENGNRLAGLLSPAQLFHGISFFMKKENRRRTWESPNGTTYAEIDHILTKRKCCLLDVSVVPSFCCGLITVSFEQRFANFIVKERIGMSQGGNFGTLLADITLAVPRV
ncbi:hypothetical protein OESDEN_07156 [Oesophagostomum dentatum]|uniref:Uncharacterized protein n=1 Tax=Oesophagostomum dentatum TaxID=61180 RepID=A0A0B1T9V4_OESDE|nr:hypothetical protein OESDEN_07156 [Oesophagostomum dentatum]